MPRNNKKRYHDKKCLDVLPEYGYFYTDENGKRISETATDMQQKAIIEALFEGYEVENDEKIGK